MRKSYYLVVDASRNPLVINDQLPIFYDKEKAHKAKEKYKGFGVALIKAPDIDLAMESIKSRSKQGRRIKNIIHHYSVTKTKESYNE